MAPFCCCNASRQAKDRSPETPPASTAQPVLPTLPPPFRLPGPLTLNAVNLASARNSLQPLSPLQTPATPAVMPDEPAELAQLLVSDSDNDGERGAGPGPGPDAPRKPSSALQRIKTRIRRVSRYVLRPKLRAAARSSQQEAERRAELKRHRHRRIREELRAEDLQEALQGRVSPASPRRGRRAVGRLPPRGGPHDNIGLWALRARRPNIPAPFVSTLGPHTNTPSAFVPASSGLEDIAERHLGRPGGCLRPRDSLHHMPPPHNVDRRGRHPGYSSGGSNTTRTADPAAKPATPPMPAIPVRDTRPDSPDAQLPSLGHSLSRSHSSPACQGSSSPAGRMLATVNQSPLRVWLECQRLESPSPSLAKELDQDFEVEGSIQEAEVVYLRRWNSVQNAALPETNALRPGVVRLHDVSVRAQQAAQTSESSQISLEPSGPRGNTHHGGGSSGVQSSGEALARQPSEKGSAEIRPPETAVRKHQADHAAAGASACYPSPRASDDPSPARSAPRAARPVADQQSSQSGDSASSAPAADESHQGADAPPLRPGPGKPSLLARLHLSIPWRSKSASRPGTGQPSPDRLPHEEVREDRPVRKLDLGYQNEATESVNSLDTLLKQQSSSAPPVSPRLVEGKATDTPHLNSTPCHPLPVDEPVGSRLSIDGETGISPRSPSPTDAQHDNATLPLEGKGGNPTDPATGGGARIQQMEEPVPPTPPRDFRSETAKSSPSRSAPSPSPSPSPRSPAGSGSLREGAAAPAPERARTHAQPETAPAPGVATISATHHPPHDTRRIPCPLALQDLGADDSRIRMALSPRIAAVLRTDGTDDDDGGQDSLNRGSCRPAASLLDRGASAEPTSSAESRLRESTDRFVTPSGSIHPTRSADAPPPPSLSPCRPRPTAAAIPDPADAPVEAVARKVWRAARSDTDLVFLSQKGLRSAAAVPGLDLHAESVALLLARFGTWGGKRGRRRPRSQLSVA